MIVNFHAIREGIGCFVDGKKAVPGRRDWHGPQPSSGEVWEVEIAGESPRKPMLFLRPVRRIMTAKESRERGLAIAWRIAAIGFREQPEINSCLRVFADNLEKKKKEAEEACNRQAIALKEVDGEVGFWANSAAIAAERAIFDAGWGAVRKVKENTLTAVSTAAKCETHAAGGDAYAAIAASEAARKRVEQEIEVFVKEIGGEHLDWN